MKKKSLGELCDIVSGGTPSRSHIEYWDKGSIPWIKIGNIKGKYVSTSDEYITQAGLDGSSAKMLPKGTLLYTIFATLGEVGILTIEACTNQAIAGISIKHNDEISTDFLYYYLKSKKSYVNKIGRGVAQNNINMSMLRALEVPVPNIAEQSRIVSVLDSVASVVTIRQQQLEKLDELVKARFVELFGDPLTNPKGYQEKYLSEIAEYWNGLTYKPDDVANEGTIVLRSSNIQNASLDFADTVRVNCKIGTKKYVQDNDILMCSRNGSAKLVGKVALIKELSEPMSFGAFMMIIRSAYYPFLMTYFQLPAFRSQITTGATTTINQITGRMLDNVKLAIPDIESAKDFSAFTNQVDKSKVAVQKSLDEAQLLFDSLMQQYFG